MSGQARMKVGVVVDLADAEARVADWQKDKMAGLRSAAIAGDGSAIRFLQSLAHDDDRELNVRQLALWSLYQAAIETKCPERQGGFLQIIQTAAKLPKLHETVGPHVLDLATRNIRYMQGPAPVEPVRSANDDVYARHLALVAKQRRATAG